MAKVGILQHFWCEPAVEFESALLDAGHTTTTIALYDGAAVPAPGDFDAWILMGGPMNIDETDKHPFLLPERELLRRLIADDRPVLGICLGAQAIARAAGAAVYPGRPKEIGLFEVETTDAGHSDPLFELLSPRGEVFQWHGDTFDLPAGAVHLARSARFPHQAFRLGRRVYAIQFHIECNARIARQWLSEWTAELAALPAGDQHALRSAPLDAALAAQNRIARQMVLRWMDL